MALSKLNSLYKAVVTDHSAHPHHQGRLEGVEQVSLNNPTCGDVISATPGRRSSTASASMRTDVGRGKTKDEALALAEIFSQMVQGKEDKQQQELGDAAFLAGVAKFPQRIKCSTLGWNALKKAIEDAGNSEKLSK